MKAGVSGIGLLCLLVLGGGIYAVWKYEENQILRDGLILIDRDESRGSLETFASRSRREKVRGKTSGRVLLDFAVFNHDGMENTFFPEVIEMVSGYSSQELQGLLFDLEQEALERGLQEEKGYTKLTTFLGYILGVLEPEVVFLNALDKGRSVELFSRWAHQFPEAAARWLETDGPEDENRQRYERTLRAAFLRNGLVSGLETTGSSFPTVLFATSDLALVEEAILNPAFALNREAMIKSLMVTSVYEGVAEARAKAESLGLGYEDLSSSFEELAVEGGMGSPEMMAWVLDVVPEQSHQRATYLEGSMGNFANRDLEEAGEWLEKAEIPEEVRDGLLGRYCYSLAIVDPVAAADWISTMKDPRGSQIGVIGQVYQHWRELDSVAAEAWYARFRKEE